MSTHNPIEPITGIPVAAFAEAAMGACWHFKKAGEIEADVFDSRVESRARYIAIAALRAVWPRCRQSEIARNMGVEGTSEAISRQMLNATNTRWWDDSVVDAIARHLRSRFPAYTKVEPVHKPSALTREEVYDPVATTPFVARKVHPARLIVHARRPRNVTGSLLGDPGHTSYREMTDQRSAER